MKKTVAFMRTFRFRMLLLMFLCIAVPSSVLGILSYNYSKDVLIENGKNELRQTVAHAINALDVLAAEVKAGKITKDEAIATARDMLNGPVKEDKTRDITKTSFKYGEAGFMQGIVINQKDWVGQHWLNQNPAYIDVKDPGFKFLSKDEIAKQKEAAAQDPKPSTANFIGLLEKMQDANNNYGDAGKSVMQRYHERITNDDPNDDFEMNFNTLPGVPFNLEDPDFLSKVYQTQVYAADVKSWSNNEQFYGKDTTVMLGISGFYHEFYASINKMAYLIAGLVVVTTVIGILLAYLVLRRSTKALSRIGAVVHEVGVGNLSEKAEIKGKDEFAILAQNVNTATTLMGGMLNDVKVVTAQVTNLTGYLTQGAEQTGTASEQIAVTIMKMAEDTNGMKDNIGMTTSIIEELQTEIAEVTDRLKFASESAEQALGSATEGRTTSEKVQFEMSRVNSTIQHSSEVVEELGERMSKIGEITQLITTIASQTNLLALNAAIEAARAGEHGRGFAVVADEVRKLAEATSKAGAEIITVLDEIQNRTGQAISVMKNGTATFGEVGQLMNISLESFNEISQAVESCFSQINGIYQTSTKINYQAETAFARIEEINSTSLEISDGMGMIAAAAEEQVATLEENLVSTGHVSELVDNLNEKVDQFKIEKPE